MSVRLSRARRIVPSVALVLIGAGRAFSLTQTTVTTYQYNADGAPTAVTTQVEGQPATTVYLTWDNFVPSSADPATGSVLAANGNLRGFGPTPGGAYTTEFGYDQRNRLTGASVTGSPVVAYNHYADSLMASSAASSDALQFYYDNKANAQIANITQSSTDTWSSYLGSITYLSDGTEQVRCQPRKDMAGVYEAAQQSFTPHRYDPYGTTVAGGANNARYDLRQNPFLYAAEYQDPVWSGYNLRGRWYLPAYQTFLGRDRGDPMHRYGYTAGDPIGHVDPSGWSPIEAGARTFLRDLHANGNGARGTLSRFFLGGIIGVTQIIANPSGYWHEMVHDTHGLDAFLALGVAIEVGTSGIGPFYEFSAAPGASFAGHHVLDLGIGAAQSVLTAHEHGRFDWASFGQGMEYTAGGIFWGREMLGFGYKPYGMTKDDVQAMAADHFAKGRNPDQMLVFRSRADTGMRTGTSPVREALGIGSYHEAVVAVGPDFTLTTEVTTDSSGGGVKELTRWKARTGNDVSYITDKRMIFVGSYRTEAVEQAIVPPDYLRSSKSAYHTDDFGEIPVARHADNTLVNNCHRYARQVLARIGQ